MLHMFNVKQSSTLNRSVRISTLGLLILSAVACGSETDDDILQAQSLGDCEGCVLLDDDPNIDIAIEPEIDEDDDGAEYLAPSGFTGEINVNRLGFEEEAQVYDVRGGAIYVGEGGEGCDGEGNSLAVSGGLGFVALGLLRRRRPFDRLRGR